MKRNALLGLFFVFIAAYLLRVWFLPQNSLTFAYDQARDAFIVKDLLQGDLKVLGPPVSGVPGLYHGVLYYYLVAPFYLFGQGNPVVVAYGLSLLSALSVFIAYIFTFTLTKKVVPSMVSALLFAVSFEATQYANLLSNPSMAIWFVPIMYLGLYLWITKSSKWGSIISGLGLGLAIQSEIALAYHIVPVIFWLWAYKGDIKRKDIIKFIVALAIALSSFFVAELKFGFKGLSGLLYLFSSQDAIVQSRELGEFLIIYLNQIGKTLAYTIFPVNIVFGGLVGIVFILYSFFSRARKQARKSLSWNTFLASYILAHIVALPFGGSNMRHITVGATMGVAIFTGIFLWKYFWRTKYVFILSILAILAANLFQIIKENPKGQTISPLQEDLMLDKEIKAIDYSYSKAEGKEFSINTLTSPLFVNTLWSYLYNWYGKEKYGYLPKWRGKDQIGQLGNNLAFAEDDVDIHFYITEPTYGIPDQYVLYGIGEEESRSLLIDKKNFGEIVVEERKIK